MPGTFNQDIATWLTAFLIFTNCYNFLTSCQICKSDDLMSNYTKHLNHWTHASVSQFHRCFVFYCFILKYSLTCFCLYYVPMLPGTEEYIWFRYVSLVKAVLLFPCPHHDLWSLTLLFTHSAVEDKHQKGKSKFWILV